MVNTIKKIIILIDHAYVSGGSAKVAYTGAKELVNRGYDVTVLAACGPLDSSLTEAGLNIICLGQHDILSETNRIKAICRGVWNPKAYSVLCNILKNCDVSSTIVHNHGWTKGLSASVFAATAKYNVKVVNTLHEFFLVCPNGGLFNYRRNRICEKKPSSLGCYLCNCDSRSFTQKIWRSLRQIVQNILVSRNKKLYLLSISDLTDRIYKSESSRRLRFIKDAEIIRVNNPVEVSVGKIAQITNSDIYLFMARLSKEKGIDLFCEAITQLGLKGIVVGDGYLFEQYKTKYPNVKFLGWKTGKEKEDVILRSKALIFPSYWFECAPLTITEVQSYGLPCIVPDRCAASEKIIDGKTGFIFEIGNIDSLKDAIIKMENTDISLMQKHIIESFDITDYSIDTHIKRLVSAYEKIMD